MATVFPGPQGGARASSHVTRGHHLAELTKLLSNAFFTCCSPAPAAAPSLPPLGWPSTGFRPWASLLLHQCSLPWGSRLMDFSVVPMVITPRFRSPVWLLP